MKRLLLILLLTLATLPVFASDASEVLAVPRKNVESADFKASGRLVRVLSSGQRLSSSLTIKAHWFPGVLRVFVQLGQAPGNQPSGSQTDLRENILLEMRPGGQNTIRVMRAADKAPREIAASEWKDTPIGPASTLRIFSSRSSSGPRNRSKKT